ncbi:MAG TPA: DUF480 domain-containing protein [Rudaea sp.]|nr:DUF480 domain-containing protein [Rudaea sp.]
MNESEAQPAASPPLVQLTPLEARVLGCLIEKAATTPEVYPLTLNAAHLACNQKSNRDPIMHAEVGAVGQALRTLEDKRLVRVVHGARALRYEHTIDAALNLMARPRAVIALLLLRGPQTLAELFTRSERLADFPNVELLGDTVDRLIARDPPLVVRIGRASGQREDRYMHLLSGPVSVESLPPHVSRAEGLSKDDRYAELEARVETLERTVAALQARLGASDTADPL